MNGPEAADFNGESIDPERLKRIARAADAGFGPAIFVLAEIYGISQEELVELQKTFREIIEDSPEPDSQ
jgi:hypothetical protein